MNVLPTNSFIETPFARMVGTDHALGGCGDTSTMVENDPYLMFCYMSKVQAAFIDANCHYETIYSPDTSALKYVIVLSDAILPVSRPESYIQAGKAALQSMLDESAATEALLIHPSEAIRRVPLWYQQWIMPAITLPPHLNARIRSKGRVYIDTRPESSSSSFRHDYMTPFEQAHDFIVQELEHFWQSGFILCDRLLSETHDLSIMAEIETPSNSQVLCVPDWDVTRHPTYPGGPVTPWLLNHILRQ